MKTLPRRFAALLAIGLTGCAYDGGGMDTGMRYPGTAPAVGTGVFAPGDAVVSQVQPPVFGTPSNIPEPIRAPGAMPAMGTPPDMDALYGYDGLGRRGMAEGDPGKAEFNFEKALEVNPFDAVALNNLAVAKAEQGQFYEAMSLLERAAKLSPDNSEVVANLARLRGYVQSYATAGVDAGPASRTVVGNLPPEPPALWANIRYEPMPVSVYDGFAPVERQTAPAPLMAKPGDDYVSDACRRVPVKGKPGRVEVICEEPRD